MSRRPVAYRDLAEDVRTALRNGEYADGTTLPAESHVRASASTRCCTRFHYAPGRATTQPHGDPAMTPDDLSTATLYFRRAP